MSLWQKGCLRWYILLPAPFPDSFLGIREPKFRFLVWITFFIKITITFTTRILILLLRDQLQGLFGVGPELSHCADDPVTHSCLSMLSLTLLASILPSTMHLCVHLKPPTESFDFPDFKTWISLYFPPSGSHWDFSAFLSYRISFQL